VSRRSWLVPLERRPAPELRLLCFPYAGASTAAFSAWPAGLPATIEVWAVQAPGRGWRLGERPLRRMQPLLDGIVDEIETAWTDRRPFALFGHSMGALVAFEVARELRRRAVALPSHLVVSGAAAPHLPLEGEPLHRLRDEKLLDELRDLNGTPPEMLDNPKLRKLLVPIVRADLELGETYRYTEELPLPFPIAALAGAADRAVPTARMTEWRRHTSTGFSLALHDGDHFFIHSNRRAVLDDVLASLTSRDATGTPPWTPEAVCASRGREPAAIPRPLSTGGSTR
jgi:medium-chain acyl-[acyl-carrier-protein] hydrolase